MAFKKWIEKLCAPKRCADGDVIPYHTIPFNTIHIPKSDFPSKIVLLSIIKRAKLTLAYSIKCPMWILYVRIQKCLVKICHFYAATMYTRIAHEAKGKIQREKRKKNPKKNKESSLLKEKFHTQTPKCHWTSWKELWSMFLHLFTIFISFYFVLSVLLFCVLFFFHHSLLDKEREKASSVDSLFHDFFLAVEYEPMYLISSSRSIRQPPRQC